MAAAVAVRRPRQLVATHTVPRNVTRPAANFQPRLEPRPADDRVFFQAILEGIARIEAEAYAKLGELGASPLSSIRTAGGGSANAAWTKMRLRALGVPEKTSLSEHAAVGTARLAWRGIGHVN